MAKTRPFLRWNEWIVITENPIPNWSKQRDETHFALMAMCELFGIAPLYFA